MTLTVLDCPIKFNLVLCLMITRKAYLLWGSFAAAAGLIISMVVTVGLLTGFIVHLVLSPGLRWIPLGMLVISGLCIVASVVLLFIGLTLRIKK